eukprot:GHVU01202284.1.p1 GENE.GHVU01202284.1~~GHVU01202284.1.p1  ORF type:complete len:155 (+),score=23.06 GHVU01202284.1:76-540(+)
MVDGWVKARQTGTRETAIYINGGNSSTLLHYYSASAAAAAGWLAPNKQAAFSSLTTRGSQPASQPGAINRHLVPPAALRAQHATAPPQPPAAHTADTGDPRAECFQSAVLPDYTHTNATCKRMLPATGQHHPGPIIDTRMRRQTRCSHHSLQKE